MNTTTPDMTTEYRTELKKLQKALGADQKSTNAQAAKLSRQAQSLINKAGRAADRLVADARKAAKRLTREAAKQARPLNRRAQRLVAAQTYRGEAMTRRINILTGRLES